ncbi:hypothetical protein HMPREF1492_0294 [Atopobium sp. BS2]|nr:hypothetical protein HMPREF1492_0294 [Atopobium sp. BS2]
MYKRAQLATIKEAVIKAENKKIRNRFSVKSNTTYIIEFSSLIIGGKFLDN